MTLIRSAVWRRFSRFNSIQFKRFYCANIRNIGILAHIDAGKTTLTERMLFYSGRTRSLGEVHRGNTITDFLIQERERGITICSSAVSLQWKDTKINILDTPGHIDFTMEVEQSLYAVDGVIVVLDGSAGVEAQTLTVWSQSEKHKLPKVVFINKMDRIDSDYMKCIEDLKNKLDIHPICVQRPVKDNKGNLSICDIITMEHLEWDALSLGCSLKSRKIENELEMSELRECRYELIDTLSAYDDELANIVIQNDGFDKITNEMIYAALRRTTLNLQIVPVLIGSAYKNIGIQRVMDAVKIYLPSPFDRNEIYDCFNNDFVGKVFKIIHDKQRGPLTLVKVFRGVIKKGMRVMTLSGSSDIVNKIYEPLADEYRDIHTITAGDVGICAGLKNTVAGDLLVSNTADWKNAQKRLRERFGMDDNTVNNFKINESQNFELINEIFCLKPEIPDAVFFCSIEPPSLSTQAAMEIALKQLQREDPSLRVNYDDATGQTVLGGMGELHLDIIKSRILSEYKIEVELGPLQIVYKETLNSPGSATCTNEKCIAGTKQSVSLTMELVHEQKDLFSLSKSPEHLSNLNAIRPKILQLIRKGAIAGLEKGPRVGGKVINTQIILQNAIIGKGTADSFIMSSAVQCVQQILCKFGTSLLEPVMALQIIAPSEKISTILSDLGRRRSTIINILPKGKGDKLILANVPLAELSGYSSILRTITSGTTNMNMQPCGFANMNPIEEIAAIRRAQGLEY